MTEIKKARLHTKMMLKMKVAPKILLKIKGENIQILIMPLFL